MNMSPLGRAALTLFEGKRLAAYQDSVGVWTIGVGHTAAAGDPEPGRGMTITDAECDRILAVDLSGIYEPAVLRHVGLPLKPHEFDALVSFTFNLGEANLRRSALLRRLNEGDHAAAGNAFLGWTRAGGNVLPGLKTRRENERRMFLHGIYPAGITVPETQIEIAKAITLRRGSKGAAARALQIDLQGLRFYRGMIDGDFGPATDAAVRAFQRAQGLSDDGIAGVKTLAAIERVQFRLQVA